MNAAATIRFQPVSAPSSTAPVSAHRSRSHEVDFLARAAWQAEGCPAGCRAAYRREIKLQLQATRDLLVRELGVTSDR